MTPEQKQKWLAAFEKSFYRNTDLKLFKVYGGWMVLADDIEQVRGLAYKRSGDVIDDSEIELIEHNATVIEGVYDNYESVCISNSEEIEKLQAENKELKKENEELWRANCSLSTENIKLSTQLQGSQNDQPRSKEYRTEELSRL